MAFSINMGEAIPESGIVELISGQTSDYKRFTLELSAASVEEKSIANNFLNVVGGHATVNIDNAIHDFNDLIFVAETNIELDILDLDYTTLSADDKAKVDAFAELLIAKANL